MGEGVCVGGCLPFWLVVGSWLVSWLVGWLVDWLTGR